MILVNEPDNEPNALPSGSPYNQNFRSTLTRAVADILRRPGLESHGFIPGVGTLSGIALANAIMEDGTQAASVDNPVGYAGDPVATLGAELCLDPTFDDPARWTANTGWAVTGGKLVATNVSNGVSTYQTGALSGATNKTYEITFTISNRTGGQVRVGLEGVYGQSYAVDGTVTQRITAAVATPRIFIQATANGTSLEVDNISVKELVGAIPARQATTANKPILRRGAVNRCLYSQDFSNAGWAGSGGGKVSVNNPDPLGNPTAVLFQSDGATSGHLLTAPTFANYLAGMTYSQTVSIKAGTVARAQLTFPSAPFGSAQYANFSLSGSGSVLASAGGTASVTLDGNGYYRCRFTATCTTSGSGVAAAVAFINSDTASRTPNYTGSVSDNMLVAFAQLETGSTASPYIPTTTAAASSPTGPYWMEFDGTDFLSLAAVPFQQADDHCVITYATTNSNAAAHAAFAQTGAGAERCGVIYYTSGAWRGRWVGSGGTVELTAAATAVGTPRLLSVRKVGATRYFSQDRVVLQTLVDPGAGAITGASIGGFPAGTTTTVGGIYPVIVIKGTVTDAELATLERYVAQASGVTL